jgi:hypothetical protein
MNAADGFPKQTTSPRMKTARSTAVNAVSKHTPAPWNVEIDVVNDGDISIFTSEMEMVAEVAVRTSPEEGGAPFREVGFANARLIAAAPELLEALKFIRTTLRGIEPSMLSLDDRLGLDMAEAAIAKAEGAQ